MGTYNGGGGGGEMRGWGGETVGVDEGVPGPAFGVAGGAVGWDGHSLGSADSAEHDIVMTHQPFHFSFTFDLNFALFRADRHDHGGMEGVEGIS